MEYVINRSVRNVDRLTRTREMAGYPRAFATEAEALAAYKAPRAAGEVFRMLRLITGRGASEFKVLRQQRWR